VLFLSLVLAFQKSENLTSAYGTAVVLVGIPFLLPGSPILIATISISIMASRPRAAEPEAGVAAVVA
jgi:K+ transporter